MKRNKFTIFDSDKENGKGIDVGWYVTNRQSS